MYSAFNIFIKKDYKQGSVYILYRGLFKRNYFQRKLRGNTYIEWSVVCVLISCEHAVIVKFSLEKHLQIFLNWGTNTVFGVGTSRKVI